MVSPSAHRSSVFGTYSGPTVIAGAPKFCSHCGDGFPKSVTAATWLAISGGIGLGMNDKYSEGTPAGTDAEVTAPATAAGGFWARSLPASQVFVVQDFLPHGQLAEEWEPDARVSDGLSM